MRRSLLKTLVGAFAFTAPVLIVPVAAVAGSSLAPIMTSWNHSKRSIDAMLAGRAPYDEAQVRQELQRFIATSSRVASGLNGTTAEGRNFAARFQTFAEDSRDVLGHVAEPTAMRASFRRVAGDCQSCHAQYNN